jgi:hypothetical protein
MNTKNTPQKTFHAGLDADILGCLLYEYNIFGAIPRVLIYFAFSSNEASE